MAANPRQVCQLLAGLPLPTGQQIEHLEAGLLVAVMFPLQPVLEIIRMVSNPRYVTGGAFLGTEQVPSSTPACRQARALRLRLCVMAPHSPPATAAVDG